MKIKSISASNFKGQTFTQPLAPVTLIAGENFRGKTARIQALSLALSSRVPGIAAKSNEIFNELASGSLMSVAVETDTWMLRRTYESKRDSVSCTVVATGIEKDFALQPLAFDASEYFGLSEAERVKFIFARVATELSPSLICDSMTAKLKNIKLEDNTPETEAAIGDIVAQIVNTFESSSRTGETVQETVAQIAADLRTNRNEADQNAKRLESTVQGLTQIATDESTVSYAGDIETLRKSLSQLSVEVGQLQERSSGLFSKLNKARRTIDEALDATAATREIETMTAKRVQLLAVEIPQPFDEDLFIPERQDFDDIADLSARKSVAFTAANETRPPVEKLQAEYQTARDAWNSATSNLRAVESKINGLREENVRANAMTCCPACGSDLSGKRGEFINNLEYQIALAIDEASKLVPAVSIAEKQMNAKADVLVTAKTKCEAIDAAMQLYRRLDSEHERLKKDVTNRARMAYDAKNRAYASAQREANELAEKISAMKSALADDSASAAAELIPTLERELSEVNRLLEDKKIKYQGVERSIATLVESERAYQRLLAEASARASAIKSASVARSVHKVTKLACEMVSAFQAELVDLAITPLIDRVNEICGDLLEKPIAYMDGKIGFKFPTGFVSTRSMSGTEQALTFCAMQIALVTTAPFKLFILDEMGRLDRNRKLKLIDHLIRLVEKGVLDQAVLVDTDSNLPASNRTGYSVVRL